MSIYPTKEELVEIIKLVSTSEKGGFDFVEFVSFMATAMDTLEQQKEVDDLLVKPEKKNNFITLQTTREEKWRKMFDLFADSEKQLVTKESFRAASEKIGDKVEDEEIEVMFSDVPEGLGFDEFRRYMLNMVRSSI